MTPSEAPPAPASELFSGYDHVSYATRDTDATIRILGALGFTVVIYKRELDQFNVYVSKLVARDGGVAELVEPRGAHSAVSEMLRTQQAVVYHTCFRTGDFGAARSALKAAGALTITKPMGIPYPVTERHATFLASHMYHPHLGVFEVTGPVVP